MKKIIILICLISFNIQANVWRNLEGMKIVNFSKLYLNSEDFHKVLVLKDKGEHHLTIKNNEGKDIYNRTRESVYSSFKFIRMIYSKSSSPIIMIVWQKGVHGEQVELLDSKSLKIKLEKTSSWPIEIIDTKKGVELVFSGAALKNKPDEFKQETYLIDKNGRVVRTKE